MEEMEFVDCCDDEVGGPVSFEDFKVGGVVVCVE